MDGHRTTAQHLRRTFAMALPRFRRPFWRTLRWQLILRTLLPVGFLVVAFALVGQLGYTQVTESLAQNRDKALASVQAARVGDYLEHAVQAMQQVVDSPVLAGGDPEQVLYTLRNESISQHFDLVDVADKSGRVVAASTGKYGESVINRSGFDFLKGMGLPIVLAPSQLSDGRDALVLSMRYVDTQGKFDGVVEGAVYFGSAKLGHPLSDSPSSLTTADTIASPTSFSYLVAGDGTILWHPDPGMVGKPVQLLVLRTGAVDSPGALITPVNGQQSLIGYGPLNLGRLLTRASIAPPWVHWYVVTQERWADIISPINSILFGLLALALPTFLISLVLVARSASALTRPVARLVAASRALSAGRLRHEIQIDGPLEIEELAYQFNATADQLQASYTDLENKVTERTRALASANSELAHRLLESQTVQVVAANMAGTAGLNEILHTIARSASESLRAEGSIVYLPCDDNEHELWMAALWNLPRLHLGTRVRIDDSMSGLAFKTKVAQVSHYAETDPRVSKAVLELSNAGSLMAVPLVSRGEAIGVIVVVNEGPGEFTDSDQRLLTLLANQAAVAIERARLYTDLQQQLKTLKTVNELALSVTVSQELDDTLHSGLEHIGKLLGASGAVIYLFDEKARTLNFAHGFNLAPGLMAILSTTMHSVQVDEEPDAPLAMLGAFNRQEAAIVDDLSSPAYEAKWYDYVGRRFGLTRESAPLEAGPQAMVGMPLTVREKRLGTMVLYFLNARHFTNADLQLYESFAKILALAIYNTQLLDQSSKLATVEERARLARELHDSVTQSLFSLSLTVRAARRVLASDTETASKLMDNVHELAQGSLAEMRALIFELRPQALQNEGLISALQKHADAVKARSGLVVKLEVQGDRRLPIEVEEALYQIAREALHNVVKHAQAMTAWVALDLSGDLVSLCIKDNGRGFDAAGLRQGGGSHIGTSTMRERAEAIHGQLAIESGRGGTEVSVKVQVPRETIPLPETGERTAAAQPKEKQGLERRA